MSDAPKPAPFGTVHVPPGAAVLVLAPHPDDFDAIGVTLRTLHRRGHAVHVAVATSGAGGVDDADCTPPTAEAKAALREAEQRASCAFFGLPEERLRFLRLSVDAGGHALVDGANVAVVAGLLRELAPAALFLPHGHDTSVGHQRTYALLRAAAAAPALGGAGPVAAATTAFLNRDPKTISMRFDVVTPYGEKDAAWKGELLRHHRTQQARNLRGRGRGLDVRILAMDRDTAASCHTGTPYAEGFEVETPAVV